VVLAEACRNVTAQLYPEVQSRKQALIIECPDALPAIRGDQRYIEQILIALIDNASKFTGENGRITVRAKPSSGNMRIEVIDTGIGIRPRSARVSSSLLPGQARQTRYPLSTTSPQERPRSGPCHRPFSGRTSRRRHRRR